MVVLVILGITFGLISFSVMPGDQQVLQRDAQRVALLLQLARDEAILRNRPIAFEADGNSYRFLIRSDSGWELLSRDDMLREREFSRAPVSLLVDPPLTGQGEKLRIVFGKEPVDKPFTLTMAHGNERVVLRADGIGHYTVE